MYVKPELLLQIVTPWVETNSMRKRGNTLSFDSRDLMRSQCEHCTRVATARELGVSGVRELVEQFYKAPDNLAIRYGMRFESQLEQELIFNLGDLVQAPNTNSLDATLDLAASGVPVIYQGTVFGGSGELPFSGRPDFLVRGDYELVFSDSGLSAVQVGPREDGYTAWDAKLSTTAKPEYQNQVALYADALRSLGLESSRPHGLILGSRELAGFDPLSLIGQLIPAREKLFAQINALIDEDPQRLEDIGALICEASSYCELCEYPLLCDHIRRQTGHLQLIAGMTRPHLESLHRAGVKTVAQLAEFTGEADKLSKEQLEKLSLQARLQNHFYQSGEHAHEIISRDSVDQLPALNPGDIFFDLEGFSFFDQPGGLEYLFGFTSVESGEAFHYRWSDDRVEEKEAFEWFMRDALDRQRNYPGCKIYHYANYEQAALKRLAERFGVYQQEVNQLLADGVFIDLYKVVKSSLVISQESYSIKKLEAFYGFDRGSDVKEAMGSMEYYDQYLELLADDYPAAEKLKRQVIAYNQEDCASTLALYSWLKSL